jgi:hypothetical protein
MVALHLQRRTDDANHGAVLQPLPPGGYTPSLEAVTYLQAEQGAVARISSESNLPLGGNAGLYYGLRDVTGDGPLHQAHYDQFLELVPEVRWWQLLNVEPVVTERTFDYPGISLALEDVEQNVRVHRLDFDQRPLWITHDVEIMPNQEAAIYFTSDMGIVMWRGCLQRAVSSAVSVDGSYVCVKPTILHHD